MTIRPTPAKRHCTGAAGKHGEERPQRLRCPNCRTRRTDSHAMFLHRVHCRQEDCHCGGYHYKHRKGSTLCVHNPRSTVNLALRQGASADEIEDLRLELVLFGPAKSADPNECPF